MGCETFKVGDGAIAIICSRGRRGKRCSVDGCGRHASKLCDFPLSGPKSGKTCDRALCDQHATQIGEETIKASHDPRWRTRLASDAEAVDVCPVHARFMKAETEARAASHEPIVVHVFADYPRNMKTRCGLAAASGAFAVPVATAEREDWGGAVEGLAICLKCARNPVRLVPPPRAPMLFPDDFQPPNRKDPTR